MYKKTNTLTICISAFILSSCARATDKTLSPPSDTQWVNVEVKNPSQYTKPFPLEVRYISHTCLKKRISGVDGSVITEPNYNVINIPLQQGANDLWKAKVAMTGGGACERTLSAFNVGIEYIDATHLGKDLVPGTAVGATIAFDDDASRNGQFTSVQGDINISAKYYPYIREINISEKIKTLSLLGKQSFMSFRSINSTHIIFSPKIDERKIVKFIEPENKIDGVYAKIVYPDGSIAPERTFFPDFDKVDQMKIK
ncbi:hypothetical protein [Rahnella sikkimica]|uniref:Lipoprotein n=1 Tax=Rahnella sikkimica TaxID=1805933 RepID=A0A2L1UX59_9GAMM|nr:hypothetical protein [Rahnella sikkimica]AVF37533.1 hypothetical protein BV494_21595 [Rahnella sikkimica]